MALLLLIMAVAATYALYPISAKLPKNTTFDQLEVLKSERKLLAYSKGKVIRSYNISLGANPEGHKQYEGDNKTPEGTYTIHDKNPNSGYHKNLGVSYPNVQDKAAAKKLGKSPGGDIKIHGLRNGVGFIGRLHRFMDWTHGCLAVTDAEIDELYAHTPVGTPIEIKP